MITPRVLPLASRMGAALSAIWNSRPSRAIRVVWLARPTTTPSRNTRATGCSAGSRVSALTMWNTSITGLPRASASFQPVSSSALGLRRVIRPLRSVTSTASPMESRVMERRCSLSRRAEMVSRMRTTMRCMAFARVAISPSPLTPSFRSRSPSAIRWVAPASRSRGRVTRRCSHHSRSRVISSATAVVVPRRRPRSSSRAWRLRAMSTCSQSRAVRPSSRPAPGGV